jgi:hypothetical protein
MTSRAHVSEVANGVKATEDGQNGVGANKFGSMAYKYTPTFQ